MARELLEKAKKQLRDALCGEYILHGDSGDIFYVQLLPEDDLASVEQHVRQMLQGLNVRIGTRIVKGSPAMKSFQDLEEACWNAVHKAGTPERKEIVCQLQAEIENAYAAGEITKEELDRLWHLLHPFPDQAV